MSIPSGYTLHPPQNWLSALRSNTHTTKLERSTKADLYQIGRAKLLQKYRKSPRWKSEQMEGCEGRNHYFKEEHLIIEG
jgi:hypothetical protein